MRRFGALVVLFAAGCLEESSGGGEGGEVVDPPCGNGRLEAGEECDGLLTSDPNNLASCTSRCRFNVCGDGELLDDEDCELDPADPGACPREDRCNLTACGDGDIDEGENCDPPDGETCDRDCRAFVSVCGDGAVTLAEACEPIDGALPSLSTCTTECTFAGCGDGKLGSDEPCDGGTGCVDCRAKDGCRAVGVVAGWESTAWWTSEGTLVAAGRNDTRQLGAAASYDESTGPTKYAEGPLARLAIGGSASVGISARGELFAWGGSRTGVTGTTSGPLRGRTPLAAPLRFQAVAATLSSAAAIDEDGALYTWGLDEVGGLGGGPAAETCEGTPCRTTPTRIGPEGVRFVSVQGRLRAYVAVSEDGRVWGWGRNDAEQLGPSGADPRADIDNSNYAYVPEPRVLFEGPATEACAGASMVAAIVDGRLVGQGAASQLGLSNSSDGVALQPIPFPPGEPDAQFVGLVCGDLHGLALASDGRILAFGANGNEGLLGLAGVGNVSSYGFVPLPAPGRSIAAGFRHSAAVLVDGSLYTWGGGGNGRLGLEDPDNHDAPQHVTAICP